ncbi:MAG TPA: TrmH family RNA methyltransferase, partial [Acidimicrobiia bacterium]|nr:TrmH family RNA methyltransferase [Acidimicrobiia bacterium]
IVVGAEGPGLSHEWLDGAHLRARIPMERGVDSLNVATAAAIAFDALRLSRRAE